MKEIQLRCLGLDDLEDAAFVHRSSFDERLPWLVGLHTPDEDRWFYRERVFPECTLCGAIENDVLVGIIAFRQDWIDQFYILPDAQGRGVGTSLLDLAKRQARSLSVWTFQRNTMARCFYERRGFVMIEETDGSGNEEREPDVLYRWSASAPTGR